MAGTELLWLAEAFERHLALLASRGHRKHRESTPFGGTNEASVMLIADRVFSGLGFLTSPEHQIYEKKSLKADLFAESPSGRDTYVVEGKIVWDGDDQRLNRKRFFEQRELLGDFDRLAKEAVEARKVVIWVVYSRTEEILDAPEEAGTLRLGNALRAVEQEGSGAILQGRASIDFHDYSECANWRFGHILCWAIGCHNE